MSAVSCETVRDALREGRATSDPELRKHAAGCEQCGALLDDEALLGRVLASEGAGEGEPLPWSRVEALLKEEVGWRAWLRSRPTYVRFLLGCAGLLVVMGLGFRRPRPDLAVMPFTALVGLLLAFGLVGGLALSAAVTDVGKRPRQRLRGGAILVAALGVPAVVALAGTATALAPGADGATFLRQAWSCFSYGTLLTLPLLLVLWVVDRGAGPRSRFLYAAAAAGVAANVALLLHCPNTTSAHLLLGHATIGLVLAAVAWLFAVRR